MPYGARRLLSADGRPPADYHTGRLSTSGRVGHPLPGGLFEALAAQHPDTQKPEAWNAGVESRGAQLPVKTKIHGERAMVLYLPPFACCQYANRTSMRSFQIYLPFVRVALG